MVYEKRSYRYSFRAPDLKGFEVKVRETDLFLFAEKDLSEETRKSVSKYRGQIEAYIRKDNKFLTTLTPYKPLSGASPIVWEMCEKAAAAGVGPMAAVAGAIAEYTGKELNKYSSQVIIENGGDIFIKSRVKRKIGLYTGDPVIDKRFVMEVGGGEACFGVCTSSGKIGHSLSFGKADAVTIISKSAVLADAAATAVCNAVKEPSDIKKAIEFSKKIKGVDGVLIIIDRNVGMWGEIKLSGA